MNIAVKVNAGRRDNKGYLTIVFSRYQTIRSSVKSGFLFLKSRKLFDRLLLFKRVQTKYLQVTEQFRSVHAAVLTNRRFSVIPTYIYI